MEVSVQERSDKVRKKKTSLDASWAALQFIFQNHSDFVPSLADWKLHLSEIWSKAKISIHKHYADKYKMGSSNASMHKRFRWGSPATPPTNMMYILAFEDPILLQNSVTRDILFWNWILSFLFCVCLLRLGLGTTSSRARHEPLEDRGTSDVFTNKRDLSTSPTKNLAQKQKSSLVLMLAGLHTSWILIWLSSGCSLGIYASYLLQ